MNSTLGEKDAASSAGDSSKVATSISTARTVQSIWEGRRSAQQQFDAA
jgi:hypothetical protein